MLSSQGLLIPYSLNIGNGALKILSFTNGSVKATLPLEVAHARFLPKEACEEKQNIAASRQGEENKGGEAQKR